MATESDVWENMELIERVAKVVNIDSSLVADLGLEVLRSAAKTHRPERGSFKTYATICLKTAMVHYKKKQGLTLELQDVPDSRQIIDDPLPVIDGNLRDLVTEEEYELLYSWFVERVSRSVLEDRYGVLRTTLWVRVQKILKRINQS